MAHYATRYEVTATKPGEQTWLVGYTPRVSRIGLIKVMQKRGPELIELTHMDDEVLKFLAKPRVHVVVNGWRIGFTGRTERDAAGDPEILPSL